MVKTLKNLLPQNQQTSDIQSWYVALCEYYQDCSNYDPGLTLAYAWAGVKIM